MLLESGEKGDPRYNVAKNLADLCSSVVESRTCEWWTILAEEISKQSIKGVTWFLLAAYSKIWEDEDGLKKGTVKQNLMI